MSSDQSLEIDSVVGPGYRVHDNQLPPELPGTLQVDKRKLAAGAFAEVHQGQWLRPGKGPVTVAIKRVTLPGKNIPEDQFQTVSSMRCCNPQRRAFELTICAPIANQAGDRDLENGKASQHLALHRVPNGQHGNAHAGFALVPEWESGILRRSQPKPFANREAQTRELISPSLLCPPTDTSLAPSCPAPRRGLRASAPPLLKHAHRAWGHKATKHHRARQQRSRALRFRDLQDHPRCRPAYGADHFW